MNSWWNTPEVGNRFRLHHLADDLRVIRDIPGAAGLIRQLRRNPVGFADFRLELHLAGALGRADRQELLGLGGDRPGPDVEARVRSDHKCGFACFRAASSVPRVEALKQQLADLVRGVRTTVFARATTSQMVVINFPEFPLRKGELDIARRALRVFLTRTEMGELQFEGLHMFRKEPPPARAADETARVRLRLHVPVPSWEKERVSRTLADKLLRESASWASGYEGTAILVVEESVFGQNLHKEVETLIADAPSFAGALVLYPAVTPDDLGIPHGLEHIEASFSPGTAGLDIGLETFADNVKSWSQGYAMAAYVPASIREDWDVVRHTSGNTACRTQPASLNRLYARVPYTDPRNPAKDPGTVQRIVDASTALLAWHDEAR